MAVVENRVPSYKLPANCTVAAQRNVRIDISREDAGPFLPGMTLREAEKTTANGMAHDAAKMHIKGVINMTGGISVTRAMQNKPSVAKTETREPERAAFISPK